MQIKFKLGKTIWWSNTREKNNKNNRWRHDTLFGFTRSYSRRYKFYVYRLTIGRFTVGFSK